MYVESKLVMAIEPINVTSVGCYALAGDAALIGESLMHDKVILPVQSGEAKIWIS